MEAKGNSTFCIGEPSWANACVGNNGMPNYRHYADGYSKAARLLLDSALRGRGDYPVDLMVYPICFNMRHSVELRLKGICGLLGKVVDWMNKDKVREVALRVFDLKGSHDIGLLWNYVWEESIRLDSRFKLLATLDDFISDIAAVDATGQTFRYPENIESSRHLTEVDLINLFILRDRFNKLETLLDCFVDLCEELLVEYGYGTFTKRLSRAQLRIIASKLPPISSGWSGNEFKKIRDQIKSEVGVGNLALDEAIQKIPEMYGSAPHIESPPLKHLRVRGVLSVFKAWFDLHGVNAISERGKDEVCDFDFLPSVLTLIEEGVSEGEKVKKLVLSLRRIIGPLELLDLEALYECGGMKYSEQYDLYIKVVGANYYDSGSVEAVYAKKMARLLQKYNFVEEVLRSLFVLGQRKIAFHLVRKYKLSAEFHWIENVSNESFFEQPWEGIVAKAYGVGK